MPPGRTDAPSPHRHLCDPQMSPGSTITPRTHSCPHGCPWDSRKYPRTHGCPQVPGVHPWDPQMFPGPMCPLVPTDAAETHRCPPSTHRCPGDSRLPPGPMDVPMTHGVSRTYRHSPDPQTPPFPAASPSSLPREGPQEPPNRRGNQGSAGSARLGTCRDMPAEGGGQIRRGRGGQRRPGEGSGGRFPPSSPGESPPRNVPGCLVPNWVGEFRGPVCVSPPNKVLPLRTSELVTCPKRVKSGQGGPHGHGLGLGGVTRGSVVSPPRSGRMPGRKSRLSCGWKPPR